MCLPVFVVTLLGTKGSDEFNRIDLSFFFRYWLLFEEILQIVHRSPLICSAIERFLGKPLIQFACHPSTRFWIIRDLM